jgi:hypothetical protein
MIAERMHERRRNRWLALGLALATLAFASGCGESSPSRMAARVLDKYRKASGFKPLPSSGMIRIRLGAESGPAGRGEILWTPRGYRETVASAGLTTVRGIESGKAYFIDQDGVTRVVSDQVLRELRTRSYFWRRAWLFSNREKAWLTLGPADTATVSLSLTPEGGNPLTLTFSRPDGRLVSARSPRFALEFSSWTEWRDVSEPAAPVPGKLAWVGLATGPIPEAFVGGGRARFAAGAQAVPFERAAGALVVPATLSGQPVRLAIDAAEDGPVAVSPALAARLGLPFTRDAFGRTIAAGATLEIGNASWPSLWLRRSASIPPGADAVAGGCLFREAIVEFDPAAGQIRLHDPEKFGVPEGFFRTAIDDDDGRPVAVLNRGKKDLRLTAGSDTGEAALLVAAVSAERAGLSGSEALGLAWGPVRLPALPVRLAANGFFPEWGDDGKLGFPLLLRFHLFVNMPQRWMYLKPLAPSSGQ